jgi:hypothetical protein
VNSEEVIGHIRKTQFHHSIIVAAVYDRRKRGKTAE